MRKFYVYVGNGDRDATNALAEAGLEVVGPNCDDSLQVPEAEGADVIRVTVSAPSVDAAVQRVNDALPPDGDYGILHVTYADG